ncbi:Rab geranylgeranyltransferase [Tilletia horrida]|uniref:Geranylgeranyl transferase type-2 subunit beta n=1 Tax=Tilletia horrida TaxID=155126 RepID=A0AAN6JSV1_9BASI|nr:Rab geranylgeranyltransferase [Tilletia horrida]KAK0568598.1 Rab geranylgeranyltransferase [Tilletia horrida]
MSTQAAGSAGGGEAAPPTKLLRSLHLGYIKTLSTAQSTLSLTYHLTTHLRLNAVYWGLCATHLLRAPDTLNRDDLVSFVWQCYVPEIGGFAPFPKHDAHILPTLSALQILAMCDALDTVEQVVPPSTPSEALTSTSKSGTAAAATSSRSRREAIIAFILSLRQPQDGSFVGDASQLENDTRFLYCACQALTLIGALDKIDREQTIAYLERCRNFDGGYGTRVGAESHSGQVFVCTATLTLLDALPPPSSPAHLSLSTWLSERQILPSGGLNGRPQKLEDVCYSWWVLSSLSMLGRLHWIDADRLRSFILRCQDDEVGGLADREGNVSDVFHTVFGVAGLSLLGDASIAEVDPVFCLPAALTRKLGINKPFQVLPRREFPTENPS